jgi:hypothetical protein
MIDGREEPVLDFRRTLLNSIDGVRLLLLLSRLETISELVRPEDTLSLCGDSRPETTSELVRPDDTLNLDSDIGISSGSATTWAPGIKACWDSPVFPSGMNENARGEWPGPSLVGVREPGANNGVASMILIPGGVVSSMSAWGPGGVSKGASFNFMARGTPKSSSESGSSGNESGESGMVSHATN